MSLAASERTELATAIDRDGWAVTPPVVPQLVIDRLIDDLESLTSGAAGRGGARNLLHEAPAVRALAKSDPVRAVAESVLGHHCFAVRALLFDKTPDANWKVIWHQDLTIAVKARAAVTGFGPWSEKAGVPHVQPPIEILEQMIAVRVHLDDCGPDNGPVRVLPGSHRAGRLSATAIDDWRGHAEPAVCLAERGAILAFRPLIVHASSAATVPAHRRVIHLEFAATELPDPLEWHTRVA